MNTDDYLEKIINLVETNSWEEAKEKLTYFHMKFLLSKVNELQKVNEELLKIHDIAPTIANFTKISLEDANDRVRQWQDDCLEAQKELVTERKLNAKLVDKVKKLESRVDELTELL